ncbi:hypothetical protein E4T50_04778 [Aureobasidium sp. EXF-12298]|nr:hypothetical protein E4T50_04778 [Aureobasidium sp. EXF-12298]KAI4762651.1 hypothetical protein E4T51_04380 [Aureobasidium sp. EXF-12344]KAI4779897.1 hypothetical protein E4T52_05201 [Aureobasidium sp. EXF-3400]
MAERRPKRQRISLGGPAVDASFEDYLTGKTTEKSSEDEEEFDQENQDPEDELEEDEEEYDEDEPEPQPAPSRAASSSTTTAPITNPRDLVLRIHAHQNNTPSSSAKDIFYLVQVWSLFGEVPVEVTRLLRVPATLLFEQFSEAICASLDWDEIHLWKFSLEPRPKTAAKKNKYPDERKEIASIKDCGPGGMHNLGADVSSSKDLDSKKVRLMDVWNVTQAPEVRNLRMFFTYDCYGDWSTASITFMGVAAEGLQAADLGVKVKRNQVIWCVGGSGASVPVGVPEDEFDEWEAETNKHEWEIGDVNKHLAEIKVKV